MKSNNKIKLLIFSLFMDLTGYLSYTVFGIGEMIDIFWAPLSAYILYKIYPGQEGKIGGLITFIEEALPITDIIPTFTLTWIYTFIIKKTLKNETK